MKKIITLLILIFINTISTAFAYEFTKPTCVMIKFSNDTRYKNIDSASVLSDLVLEKLLASGNFNLVETKPIDQDMEAMLYDNKVREISSVESAMNQGNYTPLFEGPGFDPKQAVSVATAEVGQIITPSITSAIGRQHGAEYLIQGTIINMGNGVSDNQFPIPTLYVSISQKQSTIGVQVALRVIRASTGEVVWQSSVTTLTKKTLTRVGKENLNAKIGSSKKVSDMFAVVMEKSSQDIANELIEAAKFGKLFLQ